MQSVAATKETYLPFEKEFFVTKGNRSEEYICNIPLVPFDVEIDGSEGVSSVKMVIIADRPFEDDAITLMVMNPDESQCRVSTYLIRRRIRIENNY
jgi:hypothetical protein